MQVTVIAAAIAALVLVAVTVEAISRGWLRYRRRYYVFPPGLRLRVHPDRAVSPQLPPTARFHINRDGERGDEPPRSRDGLYRILVAGGSMSEGYFLDQDTTWPGVMQRMLQRRDRLAALGASRVHVGCIARSGVGSEGLDLIFSRVLPQYRRLQLIVVVVGVTDVMHWIEQGTPDVLRPVDVGDVFHCHPERRFGWTPKRTATLELMVRARRRWLHPLDVDRNAGRWIARARTMRARASAVRDAIRDPSPMLDHFEIHFRRLLLRASAHADRVLFVRQPWFKSCSAEEAAAMWHGGIGKAWREDVKTFYTLETFSQVMSRLDARAAAVAGALGIEQLELMPILEPSLRNYYDGFHLTEVGARQVADAVTATILREDLSARRLPLPFTNPDLFPMFLRHSHE